MLTLIVGPMFSGKSSELIARTEPFKIAEKSVIYVKPGIDTRNKGVESRIGARADALAVESLSEVPKHDVYAIDEGHMLKGDSHKYIRKWLDGGAEVIVSSLDTTYDGEPFPFIVGLLCLKPDEIIIKKAVCHVCKRYTAKYTQILSKTGVPLVKDLPKDLTEDGRYEYQARCRKCFIRG